MFCLKLDVRPSLCKAWEGLVVIIQILQKVIDIVWTMKKQHENGGYSYKINSADHYFGFQ